MSGLDSARRFEYRQPRISAGFQVDFVAGEDAAHGLCKDVSDDGIRALFDDTAMVQGTGLLILRAPVGVLKMNAVVAYIEDRAVGFTFQFANPWERRMTRQFIATIADSAGPTLTVHIP